MTRRTLLLSAALVSAIALGGWVMTRPGLQTPEGSQSFDLAEGQQLYQESCASCHGDNLEGQPDWRTSGQDGVFPAPPHDETGHTWHHTDTALFDYTKLGGKASLARQGVAFESGMPGFGNQLSDTQIWDILAYIKSSWPEKERKVQADRTAAERQSQGN